MNQPSLCLFSSYLNSKTLPTFIKYYLLELKKHADEVIFITNKKNLPSLELEELENLRIRTFFVKNKGYDFGMYYQALQQIDLSGYRELILANDSCYLINSLDSYFTWFRDSNVQMGGILDSYQAAYHIQSYFLTFKSQGMRFMEKYFQQHRIVKKKSIVIDTYEVGLTNWFQSSGLEVASCFKTDPYSANALLNPAIFGIRELIKDGFPLIKRKLISGGYTRSDLIFFAMNGLVIRADELKKLIREVNPDLPANLFD